MRRKIWYVLLCVAASGLLVFLSAYAQNTGPKPVLSAAVQEHLKEIAESLPPDSLLRIGLEHGGHGDGIYHAWMDEMRQQGIRRALVSTEFVWRKKPTDIKVTRVVYFSTYDGDCGQIVDPQQLSKIRSSGLEAELSEEAVQRTTHTHWFHRGPPRRNKPGWCVVHLLDDEWLPSSPPDVLFLIPKRVDSLEGAAGLGDVAALTALLHSGVTPERRDGLVWALTALPRPCTLRALLRAGADPNMRDRDGSPLLTEEIRRDNFENAKVLIEAGADVNATNALGVTPLSFAERMPDVPAMPDIIRLLKAARARN